MRFFKRKNAVLTAAAAAVMTLGLSMSALAAESMGAVYSISRTGSAGAATAAIILTPRHRRAAT